MITHFVEEHNFKRIAYIKGPPENIEAKERYSAYVNALSTYKLTYNPELVAPGFHFLGSGESAARLLFDERRIHCDAIIADNDITARDALNALNRRGIRVPQDVALAGFDNIEESRYIKPQLTTVHQPLMNLGYEAVAMLIAQIKGLECPTTKILPTHLRIRRSCGCNYKSKYYCLPGDPPNKGSFTHRLLQGIKDSLIDKIKKIVDDYLIKADSSSTCYDWITRLVSVFFDALLKSDEELFLKPLKETIMLVEPENIDVFDWRHILNAFFYETLSILTQTKDILALLQLWNRAIEMLWEIEIRSKAGYIAESDRILKNISWIGQELIATFDIGKLKQVLITTLPSLGIERFYVTGFTRQDNDTAFSRFIEAFEWGKIRHDLLRKDEMETKFIVPLCFKVQEKKECLIIMPLFVQTEKLGFLILEHSSIEGPIYENLAIQVSNALKGLKLVEKLS